MKYEVEKVNKVIYLLKSRSPRTTLEAELLHVLLRTRDKSNPNFDSIDLRNLFNQYYNI